MAKLYKWTSIEQFRNVVKTVRERTKYNNVPIPTLTFNGTVKLHGTNAAVCMDLNTGEIWAQSRENIITPEQDNAGFARFVEENKEWFKSYLNKITSINPTTSLAKTLCVYGEWCGKGIQKGVAISELPKMFVIFGIKVLHTEESYTSYTVDQLKQIWSGIDDGVLVYSIQDFKTWNITIDFVNPELVQNKLQELTLEVEKQCPVGKAFGVEGVGEGIVWRCNSISDIKTDDLIFKVKGEKHSVTKVKTLASVDIEKVEGIKNLVANIMTDNRMQQMFDSMLDKTGLDPTNEKNFGSFIKICVEDALKEEMDTIQASGFEVKDFTKAVPNVVRQWYFSKIQS